MRARTKRRKRRRGLLSIFLFLLALAAIVFLIAALPIWKIEQVEISGAKILSAAEIRELSGVPLNENLFLTSLARTRSNLHKIAAIKKFHVYRLPPGTILISLEERKPLAVVVSGGRSAIVDGDGYIMNQNPNLTLNIPNLTDLPVISGVGPLASGEEQKINIKISKIISAIVLELGARRIQLELGGFERISFVLDDILRVKIGRAEAMGEKMAVFEKLLPVIAGRWAQVEYVDVRFPDNPVIKYR